MRLTPQQLETFQSQGFLLLPQFVEPQRCEMILDIAKAHLKHKIPPIETESEYIGDNTLVVSVRRLRQVYDRDSVFREWMEDKEIYPILEQVLGDTPMLTLAHHNSIMTKMPHTSTQTSWHQDIRYWNFTDNNLVSVWLALDDESQANGVLEFIPKSHKMTFLPEQFEAKEYFSATSPLNLELIATKTSMTLQKGDVILFHGRLLHRANKNTTDNPKISFVYSVKGEKTKALAGTRSAEYREVRLNKP